MNIQFIIVGSEILLGKILEKNLNILSTYLQWNHHLSITKVQIVQDDPQELLKAFEIAWSDGDLVTKVKTSLAQKLVIICGGLGPTLDDITKSTLSEFFKLPLKFNPEAYELCQNQYQRIDRIIPQGDQHPYCFIPENFEVLPNPAGLCVGLLYKSNISSEEGGVRKKMLMSFPGVPREFKSMVENSLPKVLLDFSSDKNAKLTENFVVRTRFIPEEKIFSELVPDLWKTLEGWGQVCSLPTVTGVDIGVQIEKSYFQNYSKLIKEYLLKLPLKDYIWQWGQLSLPEYIVGLAESQKITFGFAESCTGGKLGAHITEVAGASQVFKGTIVSYDNNVKSKLFDIDINYLNEFGAVNKLTATSMALGAQKILDCDIVISTTGITGPSSDHVQTPIGTIVMGIFNKLKNKIDVIEYQAKGHKGMDRVQIQNHFTIKALHTLLDELRVV
jgi:nicotinamide-nucleotide amidase